MNPHDISNTSNEMTKLVNFMQNWASSANINILNILPRESFIRNQAINLLNSHIIHLSNVIPNVKMVSTEQHRNLFTSNDGFRKSYFFSDNGSDNVHFNKTGLIRLAKYLKFFAHNRQVFD